MFRCACWLSIFIGTAFCVAGPLSADISYSGGDYSQNFDSLISSGTSQPWSNDSTLQGWHLFRQDGVNPPVAITTYNAGDGGSNAGSFYSFGTSGAMERALGGVASGGTYFGSPGAGTVAGWMAVSFNNATGGTLSEFTVSFNGEQWRNGGNTTPHTMVLEYGIGATFASVASWTAPGGNFDWTSPVATSTAAAVDGNSAGLVAGRGGTISNLSWANGQTLWIRWIENNDVGNDHGLAIDDFSFSAVPEPNTGLLLAGLLFAGAWRTRRRRGRGN
jgi:hypothetical protein